MTDTRPCTIKVEEHQSIEGGPTFKMVKVDKEAIFHRFGDDWTYADDAKIPKTVAIVELKETGQVMSVEPTSVQFTDLD